MATDAYAPEAITPGTHTHPFLSAHQIALAGTTTRQRNPRTSDLVTLSHDHLLTCCGRLVSSLIVGEVVDDLTNHTTTTEN